MKKESSFINIMILLGLIALICSIPYMIFVDINIPLEHYPRFLGLGLAEFIAIFIVILYTFVVSIFDPYKVSIDKYGICVSYVFLKNKKYFWKDIGRVQLKTQVFDTVAILRILKGLSYIKCGVYRMRIYGEIIRYFDQRKITTEKFDEKIDFELF